MSVGDLHLRGMAVSLRGDDDLKQPAGTGLRHGDGILFQIGGDLGHLLVRHTGKHLQMAGLISRYEACGHGGGDPTQSPRMGNDHAFYVLDDIPADGDLRFLRETAQGIAGHRGGVSQGDGLGTPHGGNQLLFQNGNIFLMLGEKFHKKLP